MEATKPITIKFKNRNATNTSDKRIAEAYSKAGKFDVDLVTSDEKIVPAHRFVLVMFSRYLANLLGDAGLDGIIVVPLKKYTYDIVKKVVHLLYFREVDVTVEDKTKLMDALKYLKVTDIANPDAINPPVKMGPPVMRQTVPQGGQPGNAAIIGQNGTFAPGKRGRSQSVYVESSRDVGMHQPVQGAQRIPAGVRNQTRQSLNVTGVQLSPHISVPKPPNTNAGLMPAPSQLPIKKPNAAQVQRQLLPARPPGTPPKMPIQPQMQTVPTLPKLPSSISILPKQVPKVQIQQQVTIRPANQPAQLNSQTSSRLIDTIPKNVISGLAEAKAFMNAQTLPRITETIQTSVTTTPADIKSGQLDGNDNLLEDMEIDDMNNGEIGNTDKCGQQQTMEFNDDEVMTKETKFDANGEEDFNSKANDNDPNGIIQSDDGPGDGERNDHNEHNVNVEEQDARDFFSNL